MSETEVKDKDEEIQVEVGETPDAGDKAPDAKIVTAEEGVEELKRRLDAEQAEKDAANARARAAEESAARERAAREEGENRELDSGLETAKANLENAKAAYRVAREKNDVEAELAATDAMQQAKIDLAQIEAAKVAREHAKKNPVRPITYNDPVEARAASLETQWPKSAAWVRQNPAWVRDPNKWAQVEAASNLALARGLRADTDAYFAEVNKTLGIDTVTVQTTAETHKAEVTPEQPMSSASRPVAPAAAPVSRNGSGPGQPRTGTVRLSREQAEIAESSYPDMKPADAHRAYARALIDLKAAGKIN